MKFSTKIKKENNKAPSVAQTLKALHQDFTNHFNNMQSEEAQKNYQTAFNASPKELGKAAVNHAAKHV